MSLTLENKINKLASKFKKPPSSVFLKELEAALAKVDERAVSDAFNKIWKSHKTFPSMAEITRLVNSELVKYKTKSIPLVNTKHCDQCSNSGSIVLYDQQGYCAIGSCVCHVGIEIRSKGTPHVEEIRKRGYIYKSRRQIQR